VNCEASDLALKFNAVPRSRKFTNWFLAVVVLTTGLTYVCDYLYIRYKMAGGNASEAFGSVQFFPATQLKNGKLDIYIESPQTETCVHALFPHYGYNPCWYAKRNQVHVVAQSTKPNSFWAKVAPASPPASYEHKCSQRHNEWTARIFKQIA
jgi:hypothetical protein